MEPDAADRGRLAATFDSAAALYQRARPEYPPALYERLFEVTGVEPPAPLLEVGCATGKATLPLARRGFRITALNPGAALADAARANLAGYEVDVLEARFEDWEPDGAVFDLVFATTAWNWVDPEVRYSKAAAVLRPHGHLALWGAGHVIPYDGDPFFEESRMSTRRSVKDLPPGWVTPRPAELPDDREEIESSGFLRASR